jgi:hypothetical protein
VTTVERCEKSDLPVDQCACSECRTDLHTSEHDLPDVLPLQVPGTWTEATYPGVCQCGCGQRYAVGAEIALARFARGDRLWCLAGHTRAFDGALGH